MKTTYLIMYTQGSMKVEYRLIASTKTPNEVIREFKLRRKTVNVVGLFKLEACNGIEL